MTIGRGNCEFQRTDSAADNRRVFPLWARATATDRVLSRMWNAIESAAASLGCAASGCTDTCHTFYADVGLRRHLRAGVCQWRRNPGNWNACNCWLLFPGAGAAGVCFVRLVVTFHSEK